MKMHRLKSKVWNWLKSSFIPLGCLQVSLLSINLTSLMSKTMHFLKKYVLFFNISKNLCLLSSRSSNTPESRYIVFVPSCSRWVFIWWSVNVLAHTHTITPASPFLQRLSGWGQYTMYCQPTRCYTVGLEFGPAEAGEGYVTWAKSPADR